MSGFAIFGYHRLIAADTRGGRYELSSTEFADHLQLLRQQGFKTLRLEEMSARIRENRRDSGEKSVMLTFDDGYESDLLIAAPLLLDHGFTAVFFVTTALVGTPGYMTPSQLRRLSDSGMEVQSHSHDHVFLPTLAVDDIKTQLQRSRDLLAEYGGREVDWISVPGGRYSRQVIAAAREVGYRGIFTSAPGYGHGHSGGLLLLKRFIFENGTPLTTFSRIAHGRLPVMLRAGALYSLKRGLRRLLQRP